MLLAQPSSLQYAADTYNLQISSMLLLALTAFSSAICGTQVAFCIAIDVLSSGYVSVEFLDSDVFNMRYSNARQLLE